MALGNILRKARESRKLTASQVASATNMKVQTVQAIEDEDFAQVPAAIYCKGFIRLYAEYMGLDSTPLIREYIERFVEPPPAPEPEPEPAGFNLGFSKKEDPIQETQDEDDGEKTPDLFSYGATRTEEPPDTLFEHRPTEIPEEDATPSPLVAGISELSSQLKSATSQFTGAIRDKVQQIVPPGKDTAAELPEPPIKEEPSAVDTSPITLPNRQVLIISGTIAGIILLIFLVSVIAGRLSGGDDSVLPDTSEHELVLPVEPPPPYID
jgi:transcriptional regulator with XRE-family HTH domain